MESSIQHINQFSHMVYSDRAKFCIKPITLQFSPPAASTKSPQSASESPYSWDHRGLVIHRANVERSLTMLDEA